MSHDRHGSDRSPRRTAKRTALLAGCAAALWLAGCGQDPADQALDRASITLASLDVGVGSQIPREQSAKQFNEVVAAMQPLASGGNTHAGDASVLLGMAQRGLGLQTASQVLELERAARDTMPQIRAHLRAWINHSTTAQAEGAYNPAPELAQIDTEVRARQQDITAQEAAKTATSGEIDGLLAQVQTRITEAAKLRDQAGSLRLRIPAVSATEGLALAEQIRSLSRRADALEFEARELKAQADQLGLVVRAAESEIEKLHTQVDLLGQSRLAVEGRGRAAQKAAADARGYAQEAAGRIADLIEDGDAGLVSIRSRIDGVTQQAVQQLTTASRSASNGKSARRSSAQLALGQIQQSLGDTHWTHAMGLDDYAGLMTELANSDPALANAAQYAQRAVDATSAATEARRAAYQAYTEAVAAYEGAGARGEAGERLNTAINRLREIAGVVGDGVIDAEALRQLESEIDEAEADTPAASAARSTAPSDPEAELRDAVRRAVALAESGDLDGALGFIHPVSDQDRELLGLMRNIGLAQARVDAATEDAFGQSFSDWAEQSPEAGALGGLSGLTGGFGVDPDALDIRIQGDEAIALTGDPNQPEVTFRRIDGEWKQILDMESEIAKNPQVAAMAPMMTGMFASIARAFDEIAAGVEAGEYADNAAVAEALGNKVMSAMMGGG